MHIRVEDLHKSFGTNVVFKGLNLEVQPGELCVIVGRSGIGKSVLLKHLVGLIKPDSGRILIDGQDVSHLSEKDLQPIRQRFGMIFQGGGLLQSLSVGDNVGLPLQEVFHQNTKTIREAVSRQLEVVGLKGREDQMPTTLSGGQRKRAAIARALTTKADCFLFDEPTAGLDPPMSHNVDQIIRRVNKEMGATTIVVTHDLITVFELADVVHMIHDGQIVASGTPRDFRKSDIPIVKEFLARGLQPPESMMQTRTVQKLRAITDTEETPIDPNPQG